MLFFLINPGKVTNELRKDQGFLGFGFSKLQVEFLEDNYPTGILAPEHLPGKDVVHRVCINDDGRFT